MDATITADLPLVRSTFPGWRSSHMTTAAETLARENSRSAADSWPLSSRLPLGAFPTAAGCARVHIRLVLAEWGMPALADTAELIVSELVTNAVRASTDADGLPLYRDGNRPEET